MAEEEVVAPASAPETSPVPSDLKRKLDDLEPEAPEPTETLPEPQVDSSAIPDVDKAVDDAAEDALPEAKRPKLDETKPDELASANGFDGEKLEEHAVDDAKEPSAENEQVEDASHPSSEGVTETAPKEEESAGDQDANDNEKVASVEASNNDDTEGKQDTEKQFEGTQDPASDNKPTSRKIDVPNDKVGVLIGKGGDTIRYLQINSGARIQITRDAESDPHSTTRPVELIGTPSSINHAEKLITAVIAEADAGGSPSLVARGIQSAQAAGVGDQLEMQVPNEKVGLIIGRGGDTIKALQTKSGARIQLIPQHLPEGDPSKERIVRITGNRRQIDIASSMIKDVMSQNVKQSPHSGGGYSQQQSYRPRGPAGPSNWGGPRGGPHSSQQNPYDYHHHPHHHRGPYPSQTSQYPSSNYGSYPPGPRGSNYSSGWEQRPGPHSGGGYDYYGGGGAHISDHPTGPTPNPMPHPAGPSPTPNMGHPPQQPGNYNYGPTTHGSDYGHGGPGPYSQTAPPPQSYGHGYDEPKYDSHGQTQHPYGHGPVQPVYPQAAAGYGTQQQYGKPPSYGMPSQGPGPQPQPQSYGPPRPSQPADAPYQGVIPSSQPYGTTAPPQQQYPYPSSGPVQQPYPSYGSDGYSQATGYPQQGGQPVQPYGQQQATGYQGYGSSYPPAQQGYPEQQAGPNSGGYGYQATQAQDPNAGYGSVPGSGYSAPPPSGQQQPGYAQPAAATQPSYEQSAPQTGAYGAAAAPVSAPAGAGYGKTVSPQPGYPPQPQYESAAQMYATPR